MRFIFGLGLEKRKSTSNITTYALLSSIYKNNL